jgi:hypothetical protein
MKTETPECNCSDNCCQTPKQKIRKKLIFFIVIIAALAIVAIKLSSNSLSGDRQANNGNTVQNTIGADTLGSKTCSKTCDTSKTSSCCPQVKK